MRILREIGLIILAMLAGWILLFYLISDFVKAIPENIDVKITVENVKVRR